MARSDGRKLKTISPFVKIIPHIMTKRSDAQVFSKQTISTNNLDTYIQERRAEGVKLNYMHLFIAVLVRVIAQRPQLNRFVMNNQLYARKGIFISLAVKRSLRDDAGEETTVKFSFTGRENIFEIISIVNRVIGDSLPVGETNEVDKIAGRIMSFPNALVKLLVGALKSMDRHNILPRAIIEASPFHTTLFFTYLKSINLDYIYHHIYDFGTTGIFVALGKDKKMPVVENDAVVVKKCCEIGYVLDERICDGLYFSNSLKLVKKYLENPYLLEEGLTEIVEDVN